MGWGILSKPYEKNPKVRDDRLIFLHRSYPYSQRVLKIGNKTLAQCLLSQVAALQLTDGTGLQSNLQLQCIDPGAQLFLSGKNGRQQNGSLRKDKRACTRNS